MNYEEALGKLYSYEKFGMHLGLERIEALLFALGNPEKSLKFIHIAGTNGKGSTTMMLANTLKYSGYTVGMFTSPFVLEFRERLQINGEMIEKEDFALYATEVFTAMESLGEIRPTIFEVEVAIAFLYFKCRACDYVCLEVGLGGRFDATNVIEKPILQIITSIGLDHCDILGDSLAKIAYEKAGIIKGGHTISYPLQDASVVEVLCSVSAEKGGTFSLVDSNSLEIEDKSWLCTKFSYLGKSYEKSLPGKIQCYNAVTVIESVNYLRQVGITIPEEALFYGLSHSYMPARMEVLQENPLIILDGSHNPDGARALEDTLKTMGDRNITVVFGVLEDKKYEEMLAVFGKYAKKLITVTPDNPRALDALKLEKIAKDYVKDVTAAENAKKAVEMALATLYNKEEVLVLCGSLYLASTLRPLLVEKLEEKGWLEKWT